MLVSTYFRLYVASLAGLLVEKVSVSLGAPGVKVKKDGTALPETSVTELETWHVAE